MLPEIHKSGIWQKYAGSIIEYAGKYGDIAKTTVIKRLRLEENLKELPHLKAAIKQVGVHKVAMLAKIAKPETDETLANNVLNMSKTAVQSLSKELRAGEAGEGHQSRPCKAVPILKKIELDEESTFLFMKLKMKLGKKLSDKDFIKKLLHERNKQEFTQKKSKTTNAAALQEGVFMKQKTLNDHQKSITGDTTRYVPAHQKRQTIAQTNGKCAYPNCNSPYQILHHTNRYSESKNHDSLTPLCKTHHEFAHNNLIQNEKLKPEQWRISTIKLPTTPIPPADILYRKYRQEALK